MHAGNQLQYIKRRGYFVKSSVLQQSFTIHLKHFSLREILPHHLKMKSVIALLAIVAVANAGLIAPATYISRAPAFDSAVIKSDRLGGNFAYSVAENHAYAASTPIVQHVQTPVAVSYSAPALTYAAAPAYGYAGYPYGYAAAVL